MPNNLDFAARESRNILSKNRQICIDTFQNKTVNLKPTQYQIKFLFLGLSIARVNKCLKGRSKYICIKCDCIECECGFYEKIPYTVDSRYLEIEGTLRNTQISVQTYQMCSIEEKTI